MFSVILRHELLQLGRSAPTIGMFVLLLAAFGFGAWNGTRVVAKHIQAQESAVRQQATMKQAWLDDLIAYERYAAEHGIPTEIAPPAYKPAPYGQPALGTNAGTVGEKVADVALLPVTGLAPFSIGQLDLQRGYSLVDMKSRFFIADNFEIANPVNLATGTFDLAFVLLFLLPILVLASTYDLLAREREAGTLALILSQRVSLTRFVAAKACARGILFLVAIVGGGAAAFVYGMLQSPDISLADAMLRFVLWLCAALIYAFFWFALAVRVSALNRSSEASATILACTWLALVIIVPTLLALAATTVYPAPPRMALKTAQRAAFLEAEANLDETKQRFYVDHAEMIPEQDLTEYTLSFLARQEAMDRAVEPVFERFEAQQARQERLVGMFRFASPAIILQLALNDISGTDTGRFADYLQQVYAYHAVRKAYFLPKYMNRQIMTSPMYAEFPRFEYRSADLTAVVRRVAGPLLVLLLVGVVICPRRITLSTSAAARALDRPRRPGAGLGQSGVGSS